MDSLRHIYGLDYVRYFTTRKRQPERVQRILARLPIKPTDAVLDVGCGTGLLLDGLGPRVGRYVGLDFSDELVAHARQLHADASNVQFFVSSIIPFCEQHPGEFDAAFALDVSEHVPDEEWLPILRAIRTTLKPTGLLHLHTPNADFFWERLKASRLPIPQLPEHVAVRSLAANVAIVERAGFTVTHPRTIPHYNILRLAHPFRRVPLIGRLMHARVLLTARRQ